MKIVALTAVLSVLALGTASAQSSGQVRNDAKSGGLLMTAAYKTTTPSRADNAVRFTSKPLTGAGAKPIYIYKAPMAVKPLKTW